MRFTAKRQRRRSKLWNPNEFSALAGRFGDHRIQSAHVLRDVARDPSNWMAAASWAALCRSPNLLRSMTGLLSSRQARRSPYPAEANFTLRSYGCSASACQGTLGYGAIALAVIRLVYLFIRSG